MSSVRFKKLFAMLSAVVLLAVSVGTLPSVAEDADGVDEMRAQMSALEEKAKELSQNISALQQDESKQEQLKAQLKRQAANTQAQIDLVANEVMALNQRIDELDKQIAEKEAALQTAKSAFKQRLRAMYMSGGNSELVMLLGADDVADCLSKAELTRSVSKYDNALMEEIVAAMAQIRAAQDELDAEKLSKASAQTQLNQKQTALEKQVAEVNAYIDEIDKQAQQLVTEQEESLEAIAEYESRIDAALEEARRQEEARREEEATDDADSSSGAADSQQPDSNTGGSQSSGFELLWPVDGFYYITSPYGWRTHPIYGYQKFHSGIDIADWGIHGQPVLAAEDGVITLADYNYGGYGNYVMVYHGMQDDGNEYATLYAHLDSYIVYEGQRVRKGDVIGYVGTTGASTGSHLHYEVRVNGSTTDPVSHY